MNPHRLRAYLLLLVVAFIWGIAGPVIKLTLRGLPSDIFLIYRFFLSALIALPILIFDRAKFPKDKNALLNLIVYCFLNSTASLGFLFWGLEKTSLLDMSILSLFGPLLLILAGYLFLKEHITAREKTGIFIALLGSFWIVIEPILKANHGSSQFLGNILILLSLISGALAGFFAKRLMRQGVSPSLLANFSFIVGFLSLLPLIFIKNGLGESLAIIKTAPFPFHLGVIYMAVFSGTIAYTLNNMGQKTIELSEAALFAYIYPVFSAILAVFLLGDKLTPSIILGSAVTLIGVALAETKKRRYT